MPQDQLALLEVDPFFPCHITAPFHSPLSSSTFPTLPLLPAQLRAWPHCCPGAQELQTVTPCPKPKIHIKPEGPFYTFSRPSKRLGRLQGTFPAHKRPSKASKQAYIEPGGKKGGKSCWGRVGALPPHRCPLEHLPQ